MTATGGIEAQNGSWTKLLLAWFITGTSTIPCLSGQRLPAVLCFRPDDTDNVRSSRSVKIISSWIPENCATTVQLMVR